MKTINIKDIVTDCGTQQRENINKNTVKEYAESIKCGSKLPPIIVFFDSVRYFLVDGFHRLDAYKQLDIHDIEADVIEGTERDALLYSAGVNGTHGLRLTNKDKRNAVSVLLMDDEWTEWTNRQIATHCHVSHEFVNKMRKEVEEFLDREVATVATPKNDTDTNQQVTEKNKKLSTENRSHNANVKCDSEDQEPENDNESDEAEFDREAHEIIELKDVVISLDDENKRLRDAIATSQLPEEEIEPASEIIAELRAQVKTLEAELDAVKSSRDSYLRENEQLKNQCAMQRKQLKKMGAENA